MIAVEDRNGGDLSSLGVAARATCVGAYGVTPGGGRRRTGCGRLMAGATPAGGRNITRPLEPPLGVPGAGTKRRRGAASSAERSTETEAFPRTAGTAGFAVATPSAAAGIAARRTAAMDKAAGDHRLEVRRRLPRAVSAYLMRFTFRPPHILRWPFWRLSALRPKPLKRHCFGPSSPGPNVQQPLWPRQLIQA